MKVEAFLKSPKAGRVALQGALRRPADPSHSLDQSATDKAKSKATIRGPRTVIGIRKRPLPRKRLATRMEKQANQEPFPVIQCPRTGAADLGVLRRHRREAVELRLLLQSARREESAIGRHLLARSER